MELGAKRPGRGGKDFLGSEGEGVKRPVVMEGVWLELWGRGCVSSVSGVGGRLGDGVKAHLVSVDVPRDNFLVKKWCARLANVARLLPDVLETPPGDGSWC